MTFKQKTVVSILLLIARMLADETWAAEIKALATHISVWAPNEAVTR
jgi:hypothetical protein